MRISPDVFLSRRLHTDGLKLLYVSKSSFPSFIRYPISLSFAEISVSFDFCDSILTGLFAASMSSSSYTTPSPSGFSALSALKSFIRLSSLTENLANVSSDRKILILSSTDTISVPDAFLSFSFIFFFLSIL